MAQDLEMFSFKFLTILWLSFSLSNAYVYAQEDPAVPNVESIPVAEEGEGGSEHVGEDVDEGPAVEVQLPARLRQKTSGASSTGRPQRYGEKSVQGTRALKRFEPEVVIKSPYKRNGVPLDVDPD